jgi:alpha-amylase
MTSVCLYFKVHQPYRLRKFQQEEIAVSSCYDDRIADADNINRLADQCYLPANAILLNQIAAHSGNFKVSFSISGTLIELLMLHRPDVIRSFKELSATGCVEFLSETYYHSLSSLHSPNEFKRQVLKHSEIVNRLFGFQPAVFRNTELIHNNFIAGKVAEMGLRGILCEGTERVLKGRDPNRVYKAAGSNIPLLLRNASLSDDIAFRFDDHNWSEHPLTAAKFSDWLASHPGGTQAINLFFDYETFGIHKKPEVGIFDFLRDLPSAVLEKHNLRFETPSGALDNYTGVEEYDVPQTISWEDNTEASCAWCDNVMQNNTLKKIYSIEALVEQSDCRQSMDIWGRLQSADHFYYMAEKKDKAEVVKYMNPFTTPREAFQNYTNLVTNFEISLIKREVNKYKKYPVSLFANTIF